MRSSIPSVPVFLAAVVAAFLPAAAHADGLPVLGIDVGSSGVASSSGEARYVTIPAGTRTIVERVAQHGGQVLAWRSLRGTFTIPAIAYDGSAGGLSADGTTLVLIEPRASFPRAETKLLVLDSDSLKPRRLVTLRATSVSTRSRRAGRGCTSSTTSRRPTRRGTSSRLSTCSKDDWWRSRSSTPRSRATRCAATR